MGSSLTLALTGDVMCGRGIDQILAHPCDPVLYEPWVRSAVEYVALAERRNGPIPRRVDGPYLWGEALDVMGEATVRIINLETAVTDRGEPWPQKGIHYRMNPANLYCLTAAGIDCCVLANNHVLDWSYPGLDDTLENLAGAGIACCGAGRDHAEATAPAVLDTGEGERVIVVGLGSTSSGIPDAWEAGPARPGVALTRLSAGEVERLAACLGSLKTPGDLVVASVHWGPNWGHRIPASHRRFARALIDEAGVDVVHGHSSHHPLAIEVHRGRPILYGCGDLINDYEGISGHEEYRPDLGLVYRVELSDSLLDRLEVVPVRRLRFRLTMAGREDRRWLAATLTREGTQFGTTVEEEGGRLVLRW